MNFLIQYKRVESTKELQQILELQNANFSAYISEEEKRNEGFVTVQHDFDLLQSMNNKCNHTITIYNNKVIGYALCMHKSFQNDIEILVPMFTEIDISLKNDIKYIVMGQICIDKKFRKLGIFRRMYTFMKQQLHLQFNMVITEVDDSNTRSLNAHFSIGFKHLKTYTSNKHDWQLISWNWAQKNSK